MRLPPDAIREHIVHPSRLHRSLAIEHFADSYCTDPRIMPLAIMALERYGRGQVFRNPTCLAKLAQTRDTLRWLLAEVQSSRNTPERPGPYVGELADLLAHAELKLASPLLSDITAALGGFAHAERIWRERLALATWDGEECWQAIERYTADVERVGDASGWPRARASLVVEALARHGESAAPRMMAWFGEVAYQAQRPQQARMRPLMAELARRLGHLRAMPELAGFLGADDDELSASAADSLVALGTDAVLRAVLEFIGGDYRTRVAAAGVLGGIKSDLAIETILAAVEHDPFGDVAGSLAQALVREFSRGANRRAREILLRFGGDTLDIERDLIALGELVGQEPSELEAWRTEFDVRRRTHKAAPTSGHVRVDPPQTVTPQGELPEQVERQSRKEKRQ